LQRLAKIAPTFVVKGNWDAWFFKDLDRFGGTGATELTGKPVKVRVQNNDIWVAGLPVGATGTVKKEMKDVPQKDYRIFLFHYPDYIEEMAQSKIDLYLAGHTHGGQVAMPFYGALIACSALIAFSVSELVAPKSLRLISMHLVRSTFALAWFPIEDLISETL
jgi:hypothetical protein